MHSLLSCQRDAAGHKAIFAFQGIDNEIELILARASIFSFPRNIDQMTVCPAHRASHGLSKAGSYAVLQETGVFLAVGSGLCHF